MTEIVGYVLIEQLEQVVGGDGLLEVGNYVVISNGRLLKKFC